MICHRHPDRRATSRIYAGGPKLCYECTQEMIAFTARGRAFGTGIGPEAHAEANGTHDDAHHNDRIHAQTFPIREYSILEGGKRK